MIVQTTWIINMETDYSSDYFQTFWLNIRQKLFYMLSQNRRKKKNGLVTTKKLVFVAELKFSFLKVKENKNINNFFFKDAFIFRLIIFI